MIVRSYTDVIKPIEAALSQSERLQIWRREEVETADGDYALCCLRYTPAVPNAPLIYLSAGTHGDEPAAVACALRVLDKLVAGDPIFAQYAWLISPCDNPFGYERDVRENEAGVDLNQAFGAPDCFPQTSFIAASLKGVHVDMAIDLHEDCDSDGFYLWERRPSSRTPIGHQIIQRVERICAINCDPQIEGHPNEHGVITLLDTVGSKGWTRERYLAESIQTGCLILETPMGLDLEKRVRIHLDAIRSVLDLLQ
ncbi:MAG: succinylglutamate desuccinylase/aspartoacylase family protein [Candidatus Poribacteria bacterium]|nr:succinylglutamate desuccinylase/aspartoacylase family protein [Candidatus Poribacteria bacterium]